MAVLEKDLVAGVPAQGLVQRETSAQGDAGALEHGRDVERQLENPVAVVGDDHDDAALHQIGDFLQDPLAIELANGLQPSLRVFGSAQSDEGGAIQSGEAAGEQGEDVRAIAQDVPSIDRRLVLDQATVDRLEPRLRAAGVARLGKVVDVVAIGQEQQGIAPAQHLFPRPGADELLIGPVAHNAQVDDLQIRDAFLNEHIEAVREIHFFAEGERIAKNQKPRAALVRPR